MTQSLPLIISSDTRRGGGDPIARTPPGQTLTRKWPVLHYGSVPHIDPATWRLRIWGLVEKPLELDWDAFGRLPRVTVFCDIHCVTHWSRLDNHFEGVLTQTLLDLVKPLPSATHVIEHAASAPGNDWTTNLPLDEFAGPDCLLATHHEGERLSDEHGGPVHCIIPRLYFWKGAKWITGIELTDHDQPGFWETNGYHMHGDPWMEERFSW